MDLSKHVKILQKNEFVENVWPENLDLFFRYRLNALKPLNSLTTIDTFSWLGGPKVTHSTLVRMSRVQFLPLARTFMFDILF